MESTFKSQKAEEQDEGLQLKLGQSIDRYEVEAWIGQGGCANVYKVRHKQLGITRALKLLQPSSPALQKRFINEGRLQAQWQHPNIVRVHDALLVENQPALILDFIDGLPLHHHIQKHRPDFQQLTDLFIGIVKGVSHAHRNGIIHRDLKPSNILIEQQNGQFVARVTDFGIAKHLNPTPTDQPKTRTDAMMGTPHYMAPEQIRHNHPITAQTDIFCLGTILFEMCCGVRPFEQPDSLQLLNAIANVEHPHPHTLQPDIPPILVHIIEGCLQVEPQQRFDSCDTIEALLRPDEQNTEPNRKISSWVILAFVGLVAIGLILFGYQFRRPQKLAAPQATHHEAKRLENRALRLMDKQPAKALALLRASASLDDDPNHSLRDPDVTQRLVRRGAMSHVVNLQATPSRVVPSPDGKKLAITARKQTWLLNTKSGKIQPIDVPSTFGHNHKTTITFTPDSKKLLLQQDFTKRTIPPLMINAQDGSFIQTLNQPVQRFITDMRTRDLLGLNAQKVIKWNERGAPMSLFKLEGLFNFRCLQRLGQDTIYSVATQKSHEGPSTLHKLDLSTFKSNGQVTLKRPLDEQRACQLHIDEQNNAAYLFNHGELGRYDLTTGETLAQITTGVRANAKMIYQKRRARLMLITEQEGVEVFDAVNLTRQHKLEGHTGSIRQAHHHPARDIFLTASSDRTLGAFYQSVAPSVQLHGHMDAVLDMTPPLHHTDDHFWTVGRDRTARRWSLAFLPQRINTAPWPTDIVDHGWSPDKSHLALRTARAVYLWHRARPLELKQLRGQDKPIRRPMLTDEHVILVGEKETAVYRISDLQRVHTLPSQRTQNASMHQGYLLFEVSDDKDKSAIHQYDLKTWTHQTHTFPCKLKQRLPLPQTLLLGCDDQSLFTLDLRTGKQRRIDHKDKGRIAQMVYQPQNKTVLISSWRGHTMRLDTTTWQLHDDGKTHADAPSLIRAANTTPSWFSVTPTGEVSIIDANGRAQKRLNVSGQPISVAIDAQDRWLAIGTRDGSIYLWDVARARLVRVLSVLSTPTQLRFDGDHLEIFDGHALWKHTRFEETSLLEHTGEWTNYRVCRSTHQVVAVVPFPLPNSIWAPDTQCQKETTLPARQAP